MVRQPIGVYGEVGSNISLKRSFALVMVANKYPRLETRANGEALNQTSSLNPF